MSTRQPLAPAACRVSTPTTIAYATGAVAYGIKDSGFGTFLLLYYNQVIGVAPGTVGLVIMAALVLDAFIDPAVGALSDRTRGRWGRRHPWMYASALPIAIGWLLLWHPPHMSTTLTVVWLFVTAVIVRSAVLCYEVPSQALTPELTADYDERTRITAWRYLLGWAGGLLMMLLAYRVFLSPRAGYPNGLLRGAGYGEMAIAAAVLMVAAILISALGTHREIKRLPRPALAPQTVRGHFRELGQTMKNRAFVVLMLAGLAAYTNQGIGYAMANYMYSYVWQLGPSLTVIPFVLMAGVLLAFAAAPIIGRHTSKPRAAVTVRTKVDRHAFVMDARLVERGVEEFSRPVGQGHDAARHRVAVHMHVEHVHEDRQTRARGVAHPQFGGRHRIDDRQQLAVGGTDDQVRRVGRLAFGVAEKRHAPDGDGQKHPAQPGGEQEGQQVDRGK